MRRAASVARGCSIAVSIDGKPRANHRARAFRFGRGPLSLGDGRVSLDPAFNTRLTFPAHSSRSRCGVTEHLRTTLQPSDYLRVLGQRKWIILPALVLVPLVAVLLSLREQPLYQASAQVLLNRQDIAASLTNIQDPTLFDANRNAQTQAQLARVPEVGRRVVQALDLRDRGAYDVLGQSVVSASEETDLLTFSVVDADRELAPRLATEYARQFTGYRTELDTRTLRSARESVDAELDVLKSEGKEGSPLYADLADKQQQLGTLETLYTARAVLVRPAEGAAQIQPKPVRNGIIGGMLGVVLALVFAFLAEALDTRVRSGDDMGEKLGLPLLARVPEPPRRLRKRPRLVWFEAPNEPHPERPRRLRKRPRLVWFEAPNERHAEAFRMLRTNLDLVNLEVKARSIVVTSSVGGEGKSTTAANLAISLARTGRRVLLADFDVRASALEKFFGIAARPGLTNVALGEVELDDAITPIAVGDTSASGIETAAPAGAAATNGGSPEEMPTVVEVLTAGPVPPNPGEFLASRRVAAILGELKTRCDVLIVDAAPLLVASETLALMGQLDALLLVARLKVLRSSMLTELQRILRTCPIPVLGYVLIGAGSESGRPPYGPYGASRESSETLVSRPEKERSGVRARISAWGRTGA
jgi:Mrp family chromosome partitioning ATPase/capsular polysaccharide biosynthesis protein